MIMSKIIRKFLYLSAILLIANVSVVFAQEEQGEERVISPHEQAQIDEINRRNEAEYRLFQAHLDTIRFEDFKIVYLTSDTAAQLTYINNVSIATYFKAEVINDWTTFEKSSTQTSPDVLFIHGTAINQIDIEWTQTAYRAGVLFIGLSMPFADMQRITGDYCLEDPNPGYLAYSPEMILYFDYNLKLEKEDRRDEFNTANLETCKNPAATDAGWVRGEHGTYNNFILSDDWLPWTQEFIRYEYAQQTHIPTVNQLPLAITEK